MVINQDYLRKKVVKFILTTFTKRNMADTNKENSSKQKGFFILILGVCFSGMGMILFSLNSNKIFYLSFAILGLITLILGVIQLLKKSN